jgi:hypothetical protein
VLAGIWPQLADVLYRLATFWLILASELSTAAIDAADAGGDRMFALIDFTRNTQRAMCLTLSAVIVAVSLSFGAYGSQAPLRAGYSVTITQLQ